MYDTIIIGGGPIGIYTALQLRKAGLKVLVVEKDEEIGIPRFCSGIISKKLFQRFDQIGSTSILRPFNWMRKVL